MLYDYAILGLRILVAVVFFSSGWKDFSHTKERANSFGLSPAVTVTLGIFHLLCAISVTLGIYIQIAAAILILTSLAGLYKKLFIWKPGIWGKNGFGWHYNLLFIFINLVFIADSGKFVLIDEKFF
jgi:putative oxidoreductase